MYKQLIILITCFVLLATLVNSDSCSYTGVNVNWYISPSDSCVITDNYDLGNGTIRFAENHVDQNISYNDFTYDSNVGGDGTDDGLNNWFNMTSIDYTGNTTYYYNMNMQPQLCNGSAGASYILKVNDNASCMYYMNICGQQGLDVGENLTNGDYEWYEYEINPSCLLQNSENKFNFYEGSSACSWRCENWRVALDTSQYHNMTAWSSNDSPACQIVRGTNPLRENTTTTDCYYREAITYLYWTTHDPGNVTINSNINMTGFTAPYTGQSMFLQSSALLNIIVE